MTMTGEAHQRRRANKTFQATIWMEFVIPGGALDASLCAGLTDGKQHFPIDETGRPTFTPSATWYC